MDLPKFTLVVPSTDFARRDKAGFGERPAQLLTELYSSAPSCGTLPPEERVLFSLETQIHE